MMYIKFNHSKPSLIEAMGISSLVMEEVDRTLLSLPESDKASELFEKALHIFRNNDEAIAYILIKIGFNIAQSLQATKKPDTAVEE